MDEKIDPKKFDQMWNQIVQYEKTEGVGKQKGTCVQKIVAIIDEVFKQCY